jgi:SAM-dependent methyltransferase
MVISLEETKPMHPLGDPSAEPASQEPAAEPEPDYAPMLAAYHRAHAGDLRRIIATLPLSGTARVLDMACGDGAHTVWLAERLDNGCVVGCDLSDGYLRHARHRATAARRATGRGPAIIFCAGAAEATPFADGSFDVAWCAHSLYTLPDPFAALGELRRVVRRGGMVAVLEQDTLHRVMLPWPSDLELAMQQAQLEVLRQAPNGPQKYFAGRRLSQLFEDADLTPRSVTPFCCMRRAPLDPDERCYLEGYLASLRRRAGPQLPPSERRRFTALADPRSGDYLLDRSDLYVVYLDILAVARRD